MKKYSILILVLLLPLSATAQTSKLEIFNGPLIDTTRSF